MTDARLTAIERAVREAALKLWARDDTVAEVVAKLTVVTEMPSIATPRECAVAARQSRREKMLAALGRHEQDGRGRDAAMRVARDFAVDREDSVEVESLARQLRRWRQKETDSVRLSSQISNRG